MKKMFAALATAPGFLPPTVTATYSATFFDTEAKAVTWAEAQARANPLNKIVLFESKSVISVKPVPVMVERVEME